MTHQAEPWGYDENAAMFVGKDGWYIPINLPSVRDRIVACINFCRGAPTELLTKLTADAGDVIPLEYHIETSIAEWMMLSMHGTRDFVNPKVFDYKGTP